MSAFTASPFFGLTLTIAAYWVGVTLQKKTGSALCNNMVISIALVIAVLKILGISYEDYMAGAGTISLLLTPATACLAAGIYRRRELLRRNLVPILAGCAAGAVASAGSVLVMCRLFGLDAELTATLLPKSVTTPIAAAISEAHGGIPSVTAAAVIFVGVVGNLTAPFLLRLFRLKDPVAAGIGIGACSHGIGTARAVELGETEGAMSGLAIGLCGLITSLLALSFDLFL